MTNVVLHHHLGLGDHFICNGLVHSLLERNNWEELHLVCKPHYSKTVKHQRNSSKAILFRASPNFDKSKE